ncbi:Tubby- protein 2 [Coemansia sp. RSA 2706]|nr:Tubby- protein 2 [Coemansia sp. RSA 2706]KAJ2316819.1 Tubby- protein 2 [Coemansia sp. RSA 2702]KAJ2320918.1 Tubby- protein 2 [Coemansia sp. RSA 2704]KAJ2364914.1 Tubby- protein 2 [Coemansia sp. RSA 2610]KAJ2737642.1 Tubby- protein 2 [Coemansia sp. Cherry 401B]
MEELRPGIEQLKRPVPLASLLQCRLIRTRLGGSKKFVLDLYEEGPEGLDTGTDALGPWLLRAYPRRTRLGRRQYTIHLPPSYTDIFSGRTHSDLVGRVDSNRMGTRFVVYERALASPLAWEDVSVVTYALNFFGRLGPRKMLAGIRAVDKHGAVAESSSAHKPLVQMLAQFQHNKHVVVLENKCPRWNADTRSFVLDFFNRVLMPSVKNFQLVKPEDVDYTVVQFGKVEEDVYSLDVRFPITPIMAFGIAISSMDHKLACP